MNDAPESVGDNAEIPERPPRERLLASGAEAFSRKGFGGASVREICELAGTSSNMIHHYFGSKRGLYDAILSGFSQQVLAVPMRVIEDPPESRDHLISRLEIFAEESLEALISHAHLFELVTRERVVFSIFESYFERLVRFLEAGKARGFVRQELDSEMLTGFILDRLGNQIIYAQWISQVSGPTVLSDAGYRKRWLKANLDLVLNGVLAKDGR